MAKKSNTNFSRTKASPDRANTDSVVASQTSEKNSLQVSTELEDWGFLQMKNSNNGHVVMSA